MTKRACSRELDFVSGSTSDSIRTIDPALPELRVTRTNVGREHAEERSSRPTLVRSSPLYLGLARYDETLRRRNGCFGSLFVPDVSMALSSVGNIR
jgi:hypothetical protein